MSVLLDPTSRVAETEYGTVGRRLAGTWMQTWLPRAGRRLGLHVYPHLLRHSIAVHVLRRGADIRYVQLLLRHACLDTTTIYLRLVPGHLRQDYDNAMPPLVPEGGRVVVHWR